MCVAVLTTSHPNYALIVIDNRDEFILRPTSRPHWWSTRVSRSPSKTTSNGQDSNGDRTEGEEVQHVLSARDLQRAEQGTWLGITRSGHFAVLTNYRELEADRLCQPVNGDKSRGALVTAWLGRSTEDSVREFVESMMADGGVQGYGGFSLLCGKLRKRPRRDGEKGDGLEPLAILSNRAQHPDQIPWIAGTRGETIGLSNAAYDDPDEWPKVRNGKSLVDQVVAEAVEKDLSEEELQKKLFWILDQDTLPTSPEWTLEEHLGKLKESIFIPPIGDPKHRDDMARAAADSNANGHSNEQLREKVATLTGTERPDPPTQGFGQGLYGTQRQTIILVDWDGNVTYTERALWDAHGKPLERGTGDLTFKYSIEGWDEIKQV
ncbi:hypothetical protein SLS53_001739 [Cytospora paraplurivora]|uniref:Uncharacterized protein n=1 Tax=Cytospora paraplurivora TaxID=2898453 RepID=A0AAN9YLW3_9PEZI